MRLNLRFFSLDNRAISGCRPYERFLLSAFLASYLAFYICYIRLLDFGAYIKGCYQRLTRLQDADPAGWVAGGEQVDTIVGVGDGLGREIGFGGVEENQMATIR